MKYFTKDLKFRDCKIFEENFQKIGFEIKIHQLSHYESSFGSKYLIHSELPEVILTHNRAYSITEVVLCSPREYYTLYFTEDLKFEYGMVHNKKLEKQNLVLLSPRTENIFRLPKLEYHMLLIEKKYFEDILQTNYPDFSLSDTGISITEKNESFYEYYSNLIFCLSASINEKKRKALLYDLILSLIKAFTKKDSKHESIQRKSFEKKYECFERAYQYIEDSLSLEDMNSFEKINICEILSEKAKSTPRSLQRYFNEFLQTSPSNYLKMRLLNQAYRRLLNNKPQDTVTAIASTFEFYNGGRFADYYYKAFGQYPKDTLNKT